MIKAFIKSNFYLFVIALIVTIVVLLSWRALDRIELQIKLDIRNNLKTVLRTTHESIHGWADRRIDDVYHLSLVEGFKGSVQDLLATSPTKEVLVKSAALGNIRNTLAPLLDNHTDLGFFVISPERINIASSRDENLGATNLLQGHGGYLDEIFDGESKLVLPLRSDVLLPGIDGVFRENEPTMFIGVPIRDDSKVIAAFTIRIDPSKDFTRIVQIARKGETGESYTFNKEGILLSESRFNDYLRKIDLLDPDAHSILSVRIADPGGSVLEPYRSKLERDELPLTKMAITAISGKTGIDVDGYRDYRGVPVVGAWLWDEEYDFGLAYEINVSEAYNSFYTIRYIIIVVLSAIFLLFLALSAVLIYRHKQTAATNRQLADEIEERQLAEKALRKSTQLMEGTFSSLADAVFIIDLASRTIISCNDAVKELFGYRAEEVVGQSTEFLHVSSERYKQFGELLIPVLDSKGVFQIEFQMKRKDGEIFYTDNTVTEIKDDHGNRSAVVSVVRDITLRKMIETQMEQEQYNLKDIIKERTAELDSSKNRLYKEAMEKMQSDNKFRTAFENANTGMCLVGTKGEFIEVNSKLCQIFGYSKEDIENMTINDITYPEDMDASTEFIKKIISEEMDCGELDKRYIHKDGHIIFAHVSSTLLRDSNNAPIYFISQVQDITQRKKNEEKIKQYADIVENMQVGLYVYHLEDIDDDSSLRMIATNSAASRFTGIAMADVLEKTLDENFPGLRERGIPQKYADVVRSGRPFEMEEITYGDERVVTRSFAVKAFPLPNNCVGIAFENITERKRTEEEISKLSNIVEHSQSSIVITDIDANITYVNPKFTEGTGYSSEEVIGKNPRLLKSGQQPKTFYKEMWKTLTSGKVWQGVFCNMKKDGTLFWENASISPIINDKGEIINYLAVKEDITEKRKADEALRKSRERYELAMNITNDGIWDMNIETGEIYYSPRWKKIIGYEDDELQTDLGTWSDRIHPDDYESVMKWLDDCINGKNEECYYEHRLRHKDGSYRWVAAKGSVAKDEKDNPVRFVGSHMDITEHKRMEEEFLKNQKLESVGLLAGGIAHDFNNILTAITSNLYLAKEEINKDEESYELIDSAEKAALKAKNLTKQLLIFSKEGAPVLTATSIAGLIKESVEFDLHGTNVIAEFDVAEDLWDVDVDEGQINQVINNLVINAVYAMPGGGTISIGAENINVGHYDNLLLERGRYIMVAVKDTGEGIKEEDLPKVFDPYFTTKETGSGLGLASSFSIVKKHGGRLIVDSTVGKGTTFFIYLPASKEVEKEVENVKPAPPLMKTGGRILVLEDEEMIVEGLEKIFRKAGFNADITKEGAHTLNLYKKALDSGNPYSLVMLDLTIPGGMGGIETIKKLKEIDRNVRAVMCSGYSDDSAIAKYAEYGFLEFIDKPYEAEVLIEKLSRLING